MLIDGEKWACEACVRGHRVSNCQHSDRPLQHINKKGRPVSQCQHCRTLRKSRSAHVRCDCSNDKTHKGHCALDNGGQATSCSCSHGARCTCAHKKETLDHIPGSDSDDLPLMEKRRIRPAKSLESRLTIFTNGHHKPALKHNNTAQKYGSPYSVPRARSMRDLSPTGIPYRSVDAPAYNPTSDTLSNESVIKDPMMNEKQERLLEKPERPSPSLSPTSSIEILNGQQKSLNMLLPGDINWSQGLDSLSSVADPEPPLFSASLSTTSIDWSHYDGLPFNNENFSTSNYSQSASFTGFDFNSLDQPGLTNTSTSGDLSEVEDFVPLNDSASKSDLFGHKFGSENGASDYGGDLSSSYTGLTQTHILANGLDDLDVFLKYSNALNHGLHTPADDNSRTSQISSPFDDSNFTLTSTTEDENEALWMGSFSPGGIAIGTGHTQSVLPDEFWV